MNHGQGDHAYSETQVRSHTSVSASAPTFEVPSRKIVAVDHPCILLNLENGLQSFGPKPNFQKVSYRPLSYGKYANPVQRCS